MLNGRVLVIVALAVLAGIGSGPARQELHELAADRAFSLTAFTPAPVGGVDTQLRELGDGGLQLSFRSREEARRLVAVESRPEGEPAGIRSLQLRCRLRLAEGHAPRLAAVFFEGDGVWFKVSALPVPVGEWVEGRLPLTSLRRAAFSKDESGPLRWERVEKVWVGLVVDGPTEGTIEFDDVRLSTRPYRATEPLPLAVEDPSRWSVGKDEAVSARLTTPDDGPGGGPCMKVEFTFPGGRHMYLVPTIRVPEADLEGYGALQFTYRAALPDGIEGLLVMLIEEGGAQYYAEPAPPPSLDWTTLSIPFEQFTLGGWTADANGKLDLDRVGSIAIAVHGTAAGGGGSGVIHAAEVRFAP